MKRTVLTLLMVALVAFGAVAEGQQEEPLSGEPERLRLATTTSTENSGLLAELLPPFEEEHNVTVDVVAVGTGAALELGRNGDADVLMVHAPGPEQEFVDEGYGVERVGFMYNDFIILGPSADPAGIEGMDSAADALAEIAAAEEVFVSRGDNSGTHTKELNVWAEAGVEPSGSWYREAGQGMGAVITISNDQQAYTLADRGTYLSYRSDIDLEVLVEGDPMLFNPYSIIAINPEEHAHVNNDMAQELVDFVTSEEGQEIIGEYRVQGEQLFVPDA